MKSVGDLPKGTRLIITELHPDDGHFKMKDSIIGKPGVIGDDRLFFIDDLPEENIFNVGLIFFMAEYKIIGGNPSFTLDEMKDCFNSGYRHACCKFNLVTTNEKSPDKKQYFKEVFGIDL